MITKTNLSPGFLTYLIHNLAFYYSTTVRKQYAARHPGKTPTVQFNDITFALHAFILSGITLSQYILPTAWSFAPSLGSRPSRSALGIVSGSFVGLGITYLVIASHANDVNHDPASSWCALDAVYALGYVKLFITLVKYTPQLLTNFRNKSTRGWSIWQILLDLVGGFLSVAQLVIDSSLQNDWREITGNPIKLLLGNTSMVFDSLFMTQHYVLYRKSNATAEEREELLADEENRRHRD